MKTFISILILGIAAAAFIAGMFYGRFKPTPPTPQQLTLEQILSIKELHLVKHTYNDLFFLHKHNDPAKTIRAIVQVPVVVTAYLDLKEVQLMKHNDSVRQILLPRALLNDPIYQVNNMVVRETRSFQIHAGKDLYPQVGQYVQQVIATRVDSVRTMAVANRILAQAEEEGKEYVINLLRELGHTDIEVLFVDEQKEAIARPKMQSMRNLSARVEATPFGYIPFR
jgi:hypothetical protein